ncbi:hypothetical protein GF386_03065 [Candidatus Pacearchaeota archaeon]|nr:hypothetical protein [Candidatus Pacearchaeota archaeon]MBD3283120.1 hypothetical protein [Candidatus Pacearchaeota archaeon]
MRNKRGDTDVSLLEVIIFFVLNIAFFAILFFFVYNTGTKVFVYEEIYAKQISLIIDNSKPEMAVLLDVEKAIEFANKNNKPLDSLFVVDREKNVVKVNLGTSKGYSYGYFSDYDVDLKLKDRWLSIIIKNDE